MSRNPIRTWLQLLRAPNLLTVPGDPVAGYLLACYGLVEDQIWAAAGASVCLYAGGLLLNDLADHAEDRRERPGRPLPSGAARRGTVAVVLGLLLAVGLGLCWWIDLVTFCTGVALVGAIASYNCYTKRLRVVGALNMGLCRGLSMMLGATAVSHGDLTYRLMLRGHLDHVWIAVGLVVAYIAAVTNLARLETQSEIPRSAKWLPLATLVAGAAIFLQLLNPNALVASVPLFVIALVSTFQIALRLVGDPVVPVPPEIGNLIRGLLLIQSALCAAVGGLEGSTAAAILVLLWPVNRLLSRWFYAS